MGFLGNMLNRFFSTVRRCVDETPDQNAHVRQSPIQHENPYTREAEVRRIKERLDAKVRSKAKGNPNTDAQIFNHPRR